MKNSVEEWRDVVGYEGLYQVSNLGRVKSLNYNKTGKEQILKPGNNGIGYLRIYLFKNGKINQRQYIHRLVAQAFISNPDNLPQVNHKDENPKNNRVENLEWCTAKYNSNYGTHNKKLSKSLLNNNNSSKQVLRVETDVVYPSATEAERKIGANHSHIIACCLGKRKTTGGYHWRYAD